MCVALRITNLASCYGSKYRYTLNLSQEQKTKVLVIKAVFPAMRHSLKLYSFPLYSRNLI